MSKDIEQTRRESLVVLSDPDVKDRAGLEAIYALAITYRLSALGVEEDAHEVDDDDGSAPSISQELKNRLESTVSAIPSKNEDAAMAEIAKSVH
ncbi:hypothetical protein [Rhizobium sophorae]|uniref:hypothetical protein n=1 Tax=Rhizobium sophorae TaxID=1535242 RepID=UPI001FE2F013|nr:hypothetical protein [Rhizobium sophorae]